MATTLNIDDILSQVKKMNKEEQNNLLQKLTLLLKKSNANNVARKHLTFLAGLGRDIWKDLDIDKYIEEERKW